MLLATLMPRVERAAKEAKAVVQAMDEGVQNAIEVSRGFEEAAENHRDEDQEDHPGHGQSPPLASSVSTSGSLSRLVAFHQRPQECGDRCVLNEPGDEGAGDPPRCPAGRHAKKCGRKYHRGRQGEQGMEDEMRFQRRAQQAIALSSRASPVLRPKTP